MATHYKTLNIIASKLGLGEEEKVLSKAAEYERLLQIKWTAGSNITDTGKVVICLDLAASLYGADLDLKTAIKFSGLKPAMYTNSKKIVENLLELNSDKLTTSMLCATLQCSGVQELADKILSEYQRQAKMVIDLNLPQYACMAVYQACRISKVKISKSKVMEKARTKPAQWAKLDSDWTKFVDAHFTAVIKKRGRQAKNSVTDVEHEEKMEVDSDQKELTATEPQIEVYEDWKKRMLKSAYEELDKFKKTNSKREPITPRRSPRKTPQKFSPYKSPSKANSSMGVRLLFPIES